MAERYIRIEVSRTQTAQVYVKVDDAAVPLDQRANSPYLACRGVVEELAERTADDMEWFGDNRIDSGVAVEVPAEEARRHFVYEYPDVAACPACKGRIWSGEVIREAGGGIRTPLCETCGGRGWKEEAGAGS